MITGIYSIRNKVNNKSYIGLSSDIKKRWNSHKFELEKNIHKNKHLQNAWNKYGKDNFEFIVLFECNKEDLRKNEAMFISLFQTNNALYGYNFSGGGEGLAEPNKELSKLHHDILIKHYSEHPERKEHMSKIMKKRFEDNPKLRELAREKTLNQFKNENFYKKYREYRSSKEFREKARISHLGKKMTPETIKKLSISLGKPVVCVETGEIFPSAKEASRSLPGNTNVNAVVSGHRKKAGGFHWKYVDTV